MFNYEEAKRPSEEGRMILEAATNEVAWVQELNAISLSHTNLTTAENGKNTAPHYRGSLWVSKFGSWTSVTEDIASLSVLGTGTKQNACEKNNINIFIYYIIFEDLWILI